MDQAEKLRNIIKQKNQQQESHARVITITSGKGGVGKSNTAVNLAIQFSKRGKKVIVFDADFGLANVEIMFGVMPKYNLIDLIYRGMQIQDIITPGPMDIGFISGGSGISGVSNLTRDQIAFLIQNLKRLDSLADIILIDTGAGISDSVLEFVISSPEVILVTTPEPSSLTDSYSLIKALHRNPNFQKDKSSIKVVTNKAISQEDGRMIFGKLNTVVSQFLEGNLLYLGMIPMDRAIDKAVRQQTPVSLAQPEAKAAKAFAALADNLLAGSTYQPKEKHGIVQIFSNLIGKK